jgi:hypothetical protein
MARGTEAAGAAGEHQQSFFPARRTANAGKPAARITAVEVALDDFLDDGPEEAILLLETALIFGQELLKVMEQYPVEHGAFRMTGTIDSGHSRKS